MIDQYTAAVSIRIRIDRNLSVPVSIQLRGQIEYGVAFGEIAAGEALPSVRDLAERLGIAPVTVGHVYRELQEKGLLETRVGRGTFVRADAPRPDRPDQVSFGLDELALRMLRTAKDLSLSTDDVSSMIAVRLARFHEERPLTVWVVGNFPRATRRYVRILRHYLPPDDRVDGITVSELRNAHLAEDVVASADVALTPPYRETEVRTLVGPKVPVLTLRFLPAPSTRQRLAGLSPLDRIGLVSADADYLVTFRRIVERYAPHIDVSEASYLGDADLTSRLAACDVVIHATGADAASDVAPAAAEAFEFQFEPNPRELVQDTLPSMHALRSDLAANPSRAFVPSPQEMRT